MTAKDCVETTIARTRDTFIVSDGTEVFFKDWSAAQPIVLPALGLISSISSSIGTMTSRTKWSNAVAERIQLLGGVSVAMVYDVAETTLIPRASSGREEVPAQISRLLHAHEIVLKEARAMGRRAAEAGDDGTNDLIASDVIRRNELQVVHRRTRGQCADH